MWNILFSYVVKEFRFNGPVSQTAFDLNRHLDHYGSEGWSVSSIQYIELSAHQMWVVVVFQKEN